MTQQGESALGKVEVLAATPEQEPIVANLLELYIHDFSEILELQIGEDGRFGYPSLGSYWREADRFPFLVRADGRLAGLALVRREWTGNEATWDMAEFFILRGCRRRGIGMDAAHQMWRRFPGKWTIRVMQANIAGRQFWAQAIAEFSGAAVVATGFDEGGKSWTHFCFEFGSRSGERVGRE
jgi:predicted acetyltransferase